MILAFSSLGLAIYVSTNNSIVLFFGYGSFGTAFYIEFAILLVLAIPSLVLFFYLVNKKKTKQVRKSLIVTSIIISSSAIIVSILSFVIPASGECGLFWGPIVTPLHSGANITWWTQ